MSKEQIEALIKKRSESPQNHLLGVVIVRKLNALGAKSQALEIAMDLLPDGVTSAEDRSFLAELFKEAGLIADSELWNPANEPDERDVVSQTVSDEKSAPPRAADVAPAGRVLRVVGGTEDMGGKVIELPAPPEQPISFRDVGGLEDVKKDVARRIIAPFTQKSLLSKFRKRAGGGVLLYGPPGCGKTMLAKATAGECGVAFQSISIPEILDPLSGMSERRMSQLFQNARNRAPAILFFDEIDALASKRTATMATHSAQLVSHFLSEMDGAGSANEGLLVLAATNVPWSLDPAFLRPGRFDRLFFVPPPDKTARFIIFKLEMGKRPQAANIDFNALADKSSGLSGADISSVVERAADTAIDASMENNAEVPIDQKMLLGALQQVKSSVSDWLTTARNYATYSNESGRYDEILAFLQKHGRG